VEKEAPAEPLKHAERVSRLSYGGPSVGIPRNCETARILVLYPWIDLPIVQNAPTFAPMN
jgi:hypothetical protein